MSNEFDEDDPTLNRNRAADLERIKQARKKRISQLKCWQQYDKLMDKNKSRVVKTLKTKFNARNVHFPQSLVLLEAAGRGDIDEVKQILLDGANPDVCNDDGLTALHQCCIDNNLAICRLLLQYRVNINATDSELWTPLHAAAACAHIDICGCLIDAGAELLALNAEGNMPYDICEEENTLDLIENAMAMRGISQDDIDERRRMPEITMLRDLQSTHVDLISMDEQGATYLHIASSCGFMDVGRYLLDNGVPVNIRDKDGWQAIHVASCWGQLEFIELLLLRGADINSTTTAGETVYEICEDADMSQRLVQMKHEIERQYEIKKTLEVKPSASMLNRRNNSGKRSTSIRRSSMREKSLMSWKEARQEALIMEAVQKQITSDSVGDSHIASPDNRVAGDLMNIGNNEEIDISQVLLSVQMVAENEMAQKEPFIRRGSSRNSFTHTHPYHSPSRDPTLLELPVDEESFKDTKSATDPTRDRTSVLIGQHNGKNLSETTVPVNKSSFIRSCDPNMSVKAARPPSAQARPKREIDNRTVTKPQKTQGCCVVM